MKMPTTGSLVKVAVAFVLFCTLAGGTVYGSFASSIDNTANEFSASSDLLPPEIERATNEKFQGGITGWVGASRSMYSYAQVEDRGNPPSGIDLVESRLGEPPFGAEMDPGNWTVDGSTYNYRMPRTEVPVDRLSPDSNPMAVFARDNLNRSASQGGFNFQYDPDPPEAEDVLIENGPGTEFVPDQGDRITFTLDEPADPSSLIGDWEATPDQRFPTTWDGAERSVKVVFESPLEYGSDPGAANRIRIYDGSGSTPVNLGRLDLWSNNWGVDCLATFDASDMEMESGNERVVVTLGTLNPSGSILTPAPNDPEECS